MAFANTASPVFSQNAKAAERYALQASREFRLVILLCIQAPFRGLAGRYNELTVPIYEFRCKACHKRTSVFTRSVSSAPSGACEHCGANDLSRLFSRVAVHRSGNGGGGLDESSFGDVDENDPRSVAKWVRKMSREMGEPLDASMQADLDRMEAGEMPDDYAGEPTEELADVD